MSELKVNTISEVTGANGVVVDSVKLKDGGVIIADAGNIGSASDTDAIAIASNGAVTFSQAASFSSTIASSNTITATVGGTGLKSVGANAQVAADASSGYAALIADGAASNSSYIFFQTAGTDKGRITVDQNGNVEIGSGGTTTGLKVDSTGAVTKPLQPAFQATPSSNSSDIAADTSHTIVADTEILDRNGDYNTSNGTFTAPVTGLYHLYISLAVADYDHDNNYSAVFIQTSNRRYTPWLLPGGQFDADGSFYISGSVIADMDANDTATFIFRNDQGTQQPFINQEFTFLGGCLLA